MTRIIYKMNTYTTVGTQIVDFQKYISDFFSTVPDDVGITADNISDKLSARAFLSDIFSALHGESGELSSLFCLLVAWVLVSYSASHLSGRINSELGISFVFSLPVLASLASLVASVASSLSSLSVFFTAAIPALCAVELTSGAVASSSVHAAQAALIASLINGFCVKFLLPLAVAMLALSPTASAGGFSAPVINALRTLYTRVLTLAAAVISILFSLQSVLASASDTASLRLAKLGAQTLIPEVGTVVSSSLSALSSGMSYVRGVVGAGAVYTVIFILLIPLLRMLLYRLAFSVAAALSDALAASSSRVISLIARSLDSVIAVYSVCGMLCLLETVLFLTVSAA